MRIRVVDHYKWNRAKRHALIATTIGTFVTALAFAGGLEGTEEPPSLFGAFVFLGITFVLLTQISSTEGEHR